MGEVSLDSRSYWTHRALNKEEHRNRQYSTCYCDYSVAI
jgi:hypothetical protein